MKKIYDAVCTIGEYTNKSGEKKKRYLTVGSVLQNDEGAISLKLDAMPTNFNGWINFYVPKEQQKEPSEQPSDEFKQAAKSSFDDMDSGIPF